MEQYQLLAIRPVHRIARNDERGIALHSGPDRRRSGLSIGLSLMLIAGLIAASVYVPVARGMVEVLAILGVFLLGGNISQHISLLRSRDRRYRFIIFDRQGIHLQRETADRPSLIPRENMIELLLVRHVGAYRVYLNGSTRCRFEIRPSSEDDIRLLLPRIGELLELPHRTSGPSREGEVIQLARNQNQPNTLLQTVRKVPDFFRIRRLPDRLIVHLTDAGGGSDRSYGRFIYTHDGHFHQMNTGTKIKLPISIDDIDRIAYTSSAFSNSERRDGTQSVTGEIYVVKRDKRIETLLRVEYQAGWNAAQATLSMQSRLKDLHIELSGYLR